MQDYYERSINALQLAGLSDRTQECYTRAVRQLVDFCQKYPDKITEKEVETYFLHRRNEDNWSASTLKIAQCGVRFFYTNVLKFDWHLFTYLKSKQEKRLPCILSREEVYSILSHVTTHHNYAYYHTLYSCGLRLSEGLSLRVSDIDSTRMMLHVHRGKGAKDRYVPLPEKTLIVLRQYWVTHRNPDLIFPTRGRGNNKAPITDRVMSKGGVQGLSEKPGLQQVSQNAVFPSTPCVTVMRPICLKAVSILGWFSATWGTATLKPP